MSVSSVLPSSSTSNRRSPTRRGRSPPNHSPRVRIQSTNSVAAPQPHQRLTRGRTQSPQRMSRSADPRRDWGRSSTPDRRSASVRHQSPHRLQFRDGAMHTPSRSSPSQLRASSPTRMSRSAARRRSKSPPHERSSPLSRSRGCPQDSLSDCNEAIAQDLMLNARVAALAASNGGGAATGSPSSSSSSSSALRTACAVVTRNRRGSSSKQAPFSKPTRVTLHVVHKQVWASENNTGQPTSPNERALDFVPSAAFKLLSVLRGPSGSHARVETMLIPSGLTDDQGNGLRQRLRLVLVLHAPEDSGGGHVVLFPRDKPHLVRIATALLRQIA